MSIIPVKLWQLVGAALTASNTCKPTHIYCIYTIRIRVKTICGRERWWLFSLKSERRCEYCVEALKTLDSTSHACSWVAFSIQHNIHSHIRVYTTISMHACVCHAKIIDCWQSAAKLLQCFISLCAIVCVCVHVCACGHASISFANPLTLQYTTHAAEAPLWMWQVVYSFRLIVLNVRNLLVILWLLAHRCCYFSFAFSFFGFGVVLMTLLLLFTVISLDNRNFY